MREELCELRDGCVVDPREHIAEVLDWVHSDPGARHDERVEKRELLAGFLAVHEEEVLSALRRRSGWVMRPVARSWVA